MVRYVLLAAFCLMAACGGKQQPAATTPVEAPTLAVDGNARLADDVVPTAYRLELTVDPAAERFSGIVEIDVEIATKTQGFVLHAEKLEVKTAQLRIGETTVEPKLQWGENNGLGLAFTEALPTGPAVLRIEYSAPLDEVPAGLYRVQVGDDWYVFSQLEPLEARKTFPSFDEPRFKTPFSVTMRVPTGQRAFANTPETSRSADGEVDVVTFATSKPLPTYLVAFAAGPLDVLEGPAIDGVPFRLIATKDRAKLGQWMVEQTGPIMKYLTDYFGEPYPYEKLDIVAVPNFAAGAMENVGLVTFREILLLLDPETASVSQKRSAISVMAHELAHMWFGNLVTLPWWDEIWLNEGFATWMASKTLHALKPELENDIDVIRSKSYVMSADSRAKATPVRQNIAHGGDIYNAFSTISYGKGASVLRLFEAWMGEEAMRTGVRAYLEKHAHGTGTTESLLAELTAASGKPVDTAMATFLDQAGAPLLSIEKSCEGDKTTLTIQQSRYTPALSKAEQTGPWNIPFCVAWPGTDSYCTLLTEQSSTVELDTKCPKWLYPSAGEVGYYRWKLPQEDLDKLLDTRTFNSFDTATKLEIFNNVGALSRAEALTAEQYARSAKSMTKQKHRAIARQAINSLYGFEELVTDEQRARFQSVSRKLIAPHLKRVGLEPKPGEPAERALLRPTVVTASAFLVEDEKTRKWAAEKSAKFLKRMDSVPADTARLALRITAWDAEASLWLSYKLALPNAPTPAARSAVIGALGSFRNPQLLQRSLDLFFTDDIRSQDFWGLISPAFGTDESFAVAWEWFTKNYDAIQEKIGSKSAPRLPGMGGGFCSKEGRAVVSEFFADPSRQLPGMQRNLDNTLESIDQCVQRREYLRGGLDVMLK